MAKEKSTNIHAGHRKRLKASVSKDPEMETFSDFEVLEYLLTFFIQRIDTNKVAHALIDKFGTLFGVLNALPSELFEVPYMTEKAALLLPNLLAITRRAELSRINKSSIKVATIPVATEVLSPYFIGRNIECFYMMMLDINDRIISIDQLSKGVANTTTVDITSMIAKISRSQACKILLAHNHPGGNLVPSNEDVQLTMMIANLMTTMGKSLIDHLIFADGQVYSFYADHRLDKVIENADRAWGTDRAGEVQASLLVQRYVDEPAASEDDSSDVLGDNPKREKYGED